ncbi:Na+/H+ antiporter NhaC family protein [Desulfosporosinus shakirovi]|uniref:Na+/H+ antiporter NhaC family protein n=1 Tax=Desulfosporosinus shakirovi TaxID=2885154 RepID=UPI001E441272|nr:Na+/H+ antiporter NhaC family protein [Desulfosporosinus sp. SRJS8]MCB8816888.1 sodium:proton antiporter [Desulfosporosinus sp. SRJS8]
MENSWVSLLPFIVVIPIAVLTKQVLPGLFAGLILGSYLIQPDLFGGITTLISYLINNLVKPNNIRIIIFLYMFAGLINLTRMTGGIKGFVDLVSRKVKTKRSAMLLIWLSTIGTFNNPNFRIVTVAPIMKLLKRRLPISTQKIGFMIEVTSNPVVALVPAATAFVGYMVSLIGTALQQVGINESPYSIFIKSIPFNFFSLVIIGIGIYYSFFGEMSNHMQGDMVEDSDAQREEEDLQKCLQAYEKETPSKPLNLLLPLSIVLVMTLYLSWRNGQAHAINIFDAFVKADALGVMLEALFVTLLLSLLLFLLQRFSIAKIVTHFIDGGNELVSVILMLALVWALSAVSEDLGFSTYIASNLIGWIPETFIAPVVFILGSFIAYFIGSSWGTWGLLMPLAVTLAHQTGSNIILVIGAVFASGTFGAFASPLSDNSITLCAILDLPVMEYARLKLKPSLIAAGITTILFGIASLFI